MISESLHSFCPALNIYCIGAVLHSLGTWVCHTPTQNVRTPPPNLGGGRPHFCSDPTDLMGILGRKLIGPPDQAHPLYSGVLGVLAGASILRAAASHQQPLIMSSGDAGELGGFRPRELLRTFTLPVKHLLEQTIQHCHNLPVAKVEPFHQSSPRC